MVDLIAALSAMKSASDVISAIRSAERKYDEATLKASLADVTSALAEGRLALADAREALAAKDAEIAALKASFARAGELFLHPSGYRYLTSSEGQPIGAPICPGCYDGGKIVQTLQHKLSQQSRCPVCSKEFVPVNLYCEDGETLAKKVQDKRNAGNAAIARFNQRRVY